MRFTISRDTLYTKGSLEALRSIEGKRAVIVIDGSEMHKFLFLERIKDYLREAGMECFLFESADPNPGIDAVEKGADFMRDHGPDVIVTVGGGPLINAAKAMWALYEKPGTAYDEKKASFVIPDAGARSSFIAVPSVSGWYGFIGRERPHGRIRIS